MAEDDEAKYDGRFEMAILMKRIKRIQAIVNQVKANNVELEALKKRFKDASSSDLEKSKKTLFPISTLTECGNVSLYGPLWM